MLLVEGRGDDILLVRRAFKQAGLSNSLHAVRSGEATVLQHHRSPSF
jgi:hypothetical protein